MTQRFSQWLSDLRHLPNIDMHISMDVTNSKKSGHDEAIQEMMDTLLAKGFNESRFHRYSQDNVTSKYLQCTRGHFDAQNFHIQPILLWWHAMLRQYDHVW